MFKALETACGGSINPDTLRAFQQAMREYETFMSLGREMFAPADDFDGDASAPSQEG